jgi:hypothetical protein
MPRVNGYSPGQPILVGAGRAVQRLDLDAGQRGEVALGLAGGVVPLLPACASCGDLLSVHDPRP